MSEKPIRILSGGSLGGKTTGGLKFDEPIQFYQSSWDIRATKDGKDLTANLFMDSKFKCPYGCELDAKNLPLTCEHGWHIEEWREPDESQTEAPE